jgi:hypothetical protein
VIDYNSKGWRTFRKIVPFKVRWFAALPILLFFVLAACITSIIPAAKVWWEEVRDVIREYPSLWGGEG